jgi:hypothetical protein
MPTPLEKYRNLMRQMLEARSHGDDVREDQLLDEMDMVWCVEMDEDDRDAANATDFGPGGFMAG